MWLLNENQRVASFSVGSKILSLVLVGDILYTGSADGILRVSALLTKSYYINSALSSLNLVFSIQSSIIGKGMTFRP